MKKRFFVIFLSIVFLLICLSGCATKDPLVGKWEFYDSDGNIVNLEFTPSGNIIHDEYSPSGTWFRMKYEYKFKDDELVLSKGQLFLENEYTEPDEEEQIISCDLDGETLVLDEKYGYAHVDEFTNEYNSDRYEIPAYTNKSGYVFSAGEYAGNKDIPEGNYDIQWISGQGSCTIDYLLSDYGKMSETFGDGEGNIKQYKSKFVYSRDDIVITGNLKLKFVPI